MCKASFDHLEDMISHLRTHNTTHVFCLEEDDTILETVLNDIEPRIRDIYRKSWGGIKTHFHEPKSTPKATNSFYTIRWYKDQDWNEILNTIFKRQRNRFKINLSHSFILYNQETGEYKFYHASLNNNRVFDFPTTINNYTDFIAFIGRVNKEDLLQFAINHRPNSKWTLASIVSTTFFIDSLKDYPIGHSTNLPEGVMNMRGIHRLLKDENKCFIWYLSIKLKFKKTFEVLQY